MKFILSLALVLFVGLASCSTVMADEGKGKEEDMNTRILATIKVSFSETVVVELFDNPISREFLSRLPVTLSFEDYARTEKISYLEQKMSTQGGLEASDAKGDFCYYAPWGNLAVFYQGHGSGRGLYILGRIVSGKEALARQKQNFTATIEIQN